MSISLHQNGKTHADLKSGLEDHIFRENEVDAERVSKYTDSYINPNETKFNQTLYWDFNEADLGEDGKPKFAKWLRNQFTEMNEKRKEEGLRAKQKNAFIASVDTLQLSDDALEAMGYKKFYDDRFDVDEKGREIAKRVPWSEQSEEARQRIVKAYRAMIEATNDRPDLYGETVVARLHVDESTPHVERVSRMVDKNNYDFNASNIINGNHMGKGMRGKKYAEARQDHFASKTREILGEDFSNRYHITRGEKGSAKADKVKKLDLYEAAVDIKAKNLAEQQERYAHTMAMQQLAMQQREDALEQREEALGASETRFREKLGIMDKLEKDLTLRETKTRKSDELDQEIKSKMATVKNLSAQVETLETKVEDQLKGLDKQYFETAMKYAFVVMNGKNVPFGKYVVDDKAKRRRAMMADNMKEAEKGSTGTYLKQKESNYGMDR